MTSPAQIFKILCLLICIGFQEICFASPDLAQWSSTLLRISMREGDSQLEQVSSTGVVVDVGGIIATSLRALSPSIREPEKFQIYVHLPEGPVLAQIEKIDAITDICILRVARTFSAAVKFEDEKPTQKVFILGFTENGKLGFVEGASAGEHIHWGHSSFKVSTYVPSEMLGGLVVGESGNVRGMLRSGKSNGSNSLVSASLEVRRVTSEMKDPNREIASQSLLQRFASQVAKQQKFFSSKPDRLNSYRTVQFGAYFLKLPLAEGGCRKEKNESLVCVSDASIDLDRNFPVSRSEWIVSKSEQAHAHLGLFEKELDDRSPSSLFSSLQCEARRVRNRAGISLVARFCASPVLGQLGLYNSDLKIHLANSKDLYLRQSLRGISLEAAATLVEDTLESIKSGSP